MSLLVEIFRVIPAAELDKASPKMRRLSRAAAEELLLAAIMLPVLTSYIAAHFHECVYASDASNLKGAFCEAPISEEIAQPLWRSGDFKGGPTFLDPWQKRVLAEAGDFEEEDWAALHDQAEDNVELCGGSGVVSEQMAKRGYVVGPIIDLTYSRQYDLKVDMRAVEWLIFLVQNRRLRSVALEPPCATFSPAALPACRSYKVLQPETEQFACTAIFLAAVHPLF